MQQSSFDIDKILFGECSNVQESVQDDRPAPGCEQLFPLMDEDILPIENPLVIKRPPRFANKREMGYAAKQATEKLLEANSGLLAYVTVKQWSEILSLALSELRERAEDEFESCFSSQTTLHGATIAYRTVHAVWSYPKDVEMLESEIKRLQEELKAKKKVAELQGQARRLESQKGLVVMFAK